MEGAFGWPMIYPGGATRLGLTGLPLDAHSGHLILRRVDQRVAMRASDTVEVHTGVLESRERLADRHGRIEPDRQGSGAVAARQARRVSVSQPEPAAVS